MLGAVLLAMSIQDPVIDLDNTIATAYMLVAQIGAAPPIIQGRYELRRTLGRGANGLVCEALDRHLQRFVALKLVPLRDARTATNAAREAQTLAQFDHANIVRIHDVGQASDISGLRVDLVYVVMELLKGANLRHWAAEQRSQRAILDVFLAAGEGLAAAHEQGFVHGDFKPKSECPPQTPPLPPSGRILADGGDLRGTVCRAVPRHAAVLATNWQRMARCCTSQASTSGSPALRQVADQSQGGGVAGCGGGGMACLALTPCVGSPRQRSSTTDLRGADFHLPELHLHPTQRAKHERICRTAPE